jgi:hypothetical protein
MRDEDDLKDALRSLEGHAPSPAAALRGIRTGATGQRGSGQAGPGASTWKKAVAPIAAAASVIAIVAGAVALNGSPDTPRAPVSSQGCRGAVSSYAPASKPTATGRPPTATPTGQPTPTTTPTPITSPTGLPTPTPTPGSPTATPTATPTPGSPTATPTASPAPPSSCVIPPYYLALTGPRRPDPPLQDAPAQAGVFSSVTGKELARVTPPKPLQTFVAVSPGPDSRTFALAAQGAAKAHGKLTAFFLVRFSPGTGTARLTLIKGAAFLATASLDAFALSPDGTKLAVAWEKQHVDLEVLRLGAGPGTGKSWTGTGGVIPQGSISWAADNRTLAFGWTEFPSSLARTAAPGPESGLRLLNTAAPGSRLMRGSRLALPVHPTFGMALPGAVNAVLSPNGAVIVSAVTSTDHTGFGVFSARTGNVLSFIDWQPVRRGQQHYRARVLWTGPAGHLLVVYAPPGHSDGIGVASSHRLVPLTVSREVLRPGPGRSSSLPLAAW